MQNHIGYGSYLLGTCLGVHCANAQRVSRMLFCRQALELLPARAYAPRSGAPVVIVDQGAVTISLGSCKHLVYS